MTRIKICGMTNLEDAEQAASLGAWAIGLIHHPASPRLVEPAVAEETGLVLGTAFGNLAESEDFVRGLFAKGPGRANPLTFPNLVLNAPAGYAAMELGLRGPNLTVCQGEASGAGRGRPRTGRGRPALGGA